MFKSKSEGTSKNKYTIRKLKSGAATVMVGTLFLTSPAFTMNAAEMELSEDVKTNEMSQETQSKDEKPAKEVKKDTSADAPAVKVETKDTAKPAKAAEPKVEPVVEETAPVVEEKAVEEVPEVVEEVVGTPKVVEVVEETVVEEAPEVVEEVVENLPAERTAPIEAVEVIEDTEPVVEEAPVSTQPAAEIEVEKEPAEAVSKTVEPVKEDVVEDVQPETAVETQEDTSEPVQQTQVNEPAAVEEAPAEAVESEPAPVQKSAQSDKTIQPANTQKESAAVKSSTVQSDESGKTEPAQKPAVKESADKVKPAVTSKQSKSTDSAVKEKQPAKSEVKEPKVKTKSAVKALPKYENNEFAVYEDYDTAPWDGKRLKEYTPGDKGHSNVTNNSVKEYVPESVLNTKQDWQTSHLDKINKLRKQNGVKPLKLDQELSQFAYMRGLDMYLNNYFEHDKKGVGSVTDQYHHMFGKDAKSVGIGLGENIHMRYASSGNLSDIEDHGFNGFLNSPGHFDNMVYDKYTHVGLGIITGGEGERHKVVQIFYIDDGSGGLKAYTSNGTSISKDDYKPVTQPVENSTSKDKDKTDKAPVKTPSNQKESAIDKSPASNKETAKDVSKQPLPAKDESKESTTGKEQTPASSKASADEKAPAKPSGAKNSTVEKDTAADEEKSPAPIRDSAESATERISAGKDESKEVESKSKTEVSVDAPKSNPSAIVESLNHSTDVQADTNSVDTVSAETSPVRQTEDSKQVAGAQSASNESESIQFNFSNNKQTAAESTESAETDNQVSEKVEDASSEAVSEDTEHNLPNTGSGLDIWTVIGGIIMLSLATVGIVLFKRKSKK